MAKFKGVIGYSTNLEVRPGIWDDSIIEKSYKGDIIKQEKQWQPSEHGSNDNINISNRFSIISDDYAICNIENMRYICWNKLYWKIIRVEIQRPRLILTVGGVYNGPKNSIAN